MGQNNTDSVGFVETRTIRVVEQEEPLPLECGKTLGPIDVAYETCGQLNDSGDNAILICHALSGNAHVAGYNHPADEKPGWWDGMIGPGKGIDTNKYFVICSNFLGGCSGTTGPSAMNPVTGRPYGLDFPIITIAKRAGPKESLGACPTNSFRGILSFSVSAVAPDLSVPLPVGARCRPFATGSRPTCKP